MKKLVQAFLVMFSACCGMQVHAQAVATPSEHSVQVVTLYSVPRPTPVTVPSFGNDSGSVSVRVVDGGVKSDNGGCFDLSADGRITAAPGTCYILRSAAPGEKMPSQGNN